MSVCLSSTLDERGIFLLLELWIRKEHGHLFKQGEDGGKVALDAIIR